MSGRRRFIAALGTVMVFALGGVALTAPPAAAAGPAVAVGPVVALAGHAAAADAALQHIQSGERAIGPGTRLMYYASSASLQGSLQQAQWNANCDPLTDPNCWVDPSGNRVKNFDTAASAGDGFTQVDVLYLEGQTCVLRVTNHVRDPTTNAVIGSGATGVVTRDGCADYWIPPEQLGDILGVRHAGLRVLSGPYPLGGQTFDAIYVTTTSAAARYHASYEAASGLLLVHSGQVQGSSGAVISNTGQVQPARGGNLVSYGHLIGTMTMPAVPAPTPLPDAVARISGLTYACSLTLAYPGTPPIQTPCQQDFEVVERAPYWLGLRVMRQTASMMGPIPDVAEGQDVLTAGGYGGVYASVPWLRSLAPGAVLEDDTITGVRAWVDRADASGVVVVATAMTQRLTYVYDPQSGWLTRLVLEQHTGPMTSVTQLDLQQVR